jgi:pseudoazurin
MSKNKAVIVAVVMVLLALFVVIAVTSVMKDDSHERYGQISSEQQAAEDNAATAPDATMSEPEAAEPDMETQAKQAAAEVEENMDAAAEAAGDAMDSASEEASDAMQAAEEKAGEMADATQAAAADVADKAKDMAEDAKQAATGGEIHIVTAQGLKYNPLVTTIQPGDTVAWENMPTHDTQSLEGLIPEGAEYWHSPLGENFQRTFNVEGIYVYKCTPHFGSGMGGAIIVGKPVNLDAIKAADAKGAAGRLVRKAIAAAEQM